MKSPENTKKDNKIEQRFLGYEWSNRKGDEGLKYLNVKASKKAKDDEAADDDTISQVKGINGIITPLFNPLNLNDDHRINTLICKNFNQAIDDIPEELSQYVSSYSLTSLLDFKQTGFDKNININIAYKVNYQSKYDLVPLSKYVIVNPSKTEIKGLSNETEVSFIEMASVSDRGYINNKVSKTLEELHKGSYTYFAENDIIVAKITPCMENGKCAIAKDLLNGIALGSTEFHVFRCMPQIKNGYLFALLNNDYVREIAQKNMKGSSGHKRVPELFYKEMMIPLPPLKVQEKIANEISEIDEICKRQQALIVENQELISEFFNSSSSDKFEYTLDSLCKDIYAGGDKPQNFSKDKTDICSIPVYSNGTGDNALFGYTDRARTEETCVTIAARGTLGYTILHEEPFFPIVRLIVAIPNQELVLPKYLKYALDEIEFINTGSATPQLTVPQVGKYRIPVPSIEEQKKVIAKIEKCEAKINEARSFIKSCPAKKQEILDKYLK